MATPLIKNLLGNSLPVPAGRVLEGEVIGGPLGPQVIRQGLPGGNIIDGEVVQPSPSLPSLLGLPEPVQSMGATPTIGGAMPPGGGVLKPMLGGTAAAGGGAALVLMGDDGEAAAQDVDTTPEGVPLTPRQQAVKDATKVLAEDADITSDDFEKNVRESLPQDAPWFDTFASEFDLLTVGMALLASNDGSKPFSANLGDALMLGRAARHKRNRELEEKAASISAAEATAAQQDFENTMAVENLKVDRAKAEASGETAAASMLRSKADMVTATTNAAKALKEATGYAPPEPSKQDLATIGAEVETITGISMNTKNNTSDLVTASNIYQVVKQAEHDAKQRGVSFGPQERAAAIRSGLEGSIKPSMWPWSNGSIDPNRIGVGTQPTAGQMIINGVPVQRLN